MKKIIILLIILSIGCAKEEDDKNGAIPPESTKKKLENLVDESSPEERQLLAETMAAIQAYATEFSETVDFTQVPILVTAKKDIIKVGHGLCLYDGKKGLKIYLKKDYFTAELFEKDTGFASNIFNLLVHEIGHCYLLRKHEHEYITKEGHKVRFKVEKPNETATVSYYAIPASMMMDDDSFRIPKKLEKYYVGEIFGKFRAKTFEELQEKYELEIIKE